MSHRKQYQARDVTIVRSGGMRCGRIHSGVTSWTTAKMARVTAVVASPVSVSLTVSHRVRVLLWFQASWQVSVLSSRAISGAPRKMPVIAGAPPAVSARDGHGMILIERCVDIRDATYRVDLGRPGTLKSSGP